MRVVDDLAGAHGNHAPQLLIARNSSLSTVDKSELAFVQRLDRDVGLGAGGQRPQSLAPDLPRRGDSRARDHLR